MPAGQAPRDLWEQPVVYIPYNSHSDLAGIKQRHTGLGHAPHELCPAPLGSLRPKQTRMRTGTFCIPHTSHVTCGIPAYAAHWGRSSGTLPQAPMVQVNGQSTVPVRHYTYAKQIEEYMGRTTPAKGSPPPPLQVSYSPKKLPKGYHGEQAKPHSKQKIHRCSYLEAARHVLPPTTYQKKPT